MKAKFPSFQPVSYLYYTGGTAMHYNNEQESLKGVIDIGTGGVLFKFYKATNPTTVTLFLEEVGGSHDLADPVDLEVSPERTQFVLYEDFPGSYTKNHYQAWFKIWLSGDSKTSPTVKVDVLRRIK